MFPLIETAIGFLAVMLLLSLLVKSLTTLIKDHFDFYTDNLQYEVSRLIRNAVGRSWSDLRRDPAVVAKAPWIADINWSRVGDEFFNVDNVKWLLTQIDPNVDVTNIEGRLKVHLSRVQYMFEQRMKNLAIAVGIALCMLLDINAATIWRTLYTHDQLRTTFASDVATQALVDAQKAGAAPQSSPASPTPVTPSAQEDSGAQREQQRQRLKEAGDQFRTNLTDFTKQVNFGVGRIWKEDLTGWALLIEFISALLTGILVSVGAPYWHDLLENLTSLRQPKT